MRILLTGASGFVGRGILEGLIHQGHQVRCLVHSNPRLPDAWIQGGQVETVQGDILNPSSLTQAMTGCDAVIHLVGIIREKKSRGITFERMHVEGTRNVVNAAKATGIRRLLHMSALGARPGATAPYHTTKWRAEEYVRSSGLDWTIFRPSVIFGPGDEFVNMLAGALKKAPMFPIFGDGQYALQPVSRQDVTSGFVQALHLPHTLGQTYEVGGPEPIAYRDLIRIIGHAVGKKRVFTFSVPIAIIRPIVNLMENVSFFPITPSQLTMLLEGNTCNPEKFARDFRLQLLPFAEGISTYLK